MSDWIQHLPLHDGAPFLGKIRLIRELGRGGMGVVYAGWHSVLDIPVAIKVLKSSSQSTSDSSDTATRFLREARICAAIDEPGLVRVFDFDYTLDGAYLVMEYVPGRNLDEIVDENGPLIESEVLSILRDLAVTLLSLHRNGIVHRDIKPSNLLLRANDGRIKLTDLGIAKVQSKEDLGQTKGIVGTPSFMSPEQFQDPLNVGPASDFFSLGTTAFHLLTGEKPFDSGTIFETMRNICDKPLPEEVLVRCGVSDSTIELIHLLTAKNVIDRISSSQQLMAKLPTTSIPFRGITLEAAKPSRVVKRNDSSNLTGETGNHSTSGTRATSSLASSTHKIALPPSLLICECLQNDFIAPIAPGTPPPNKLHIGREESLRLVGPDPAKGPLVRALSACAIAEHVRIIHIRDWHDPDDPRQQAEMEFFGPHCIMGSQGAKFVDAVEAFSRDRGRSAIVDATGINDFVDTPLADILDTMIEGADPATTPVGVVGVWTNVKIHYLLYDLKTRAGFQNLATCSKLVAAPDRIEHRNALRQMETVLGVKVFHDVDEFLEFLGVQAPYSIAENLTGTVIAN